MKKLALFLLVAFATTSCDFLDDIFDDDTECPFIREELVPEAVLDAFEDNFPDEPPVVWCDIGDMEYVAAFRDDNVALFNEQGDLLHHGDDDEIEDRGGCECEFDESKLADDGDDGDGDDEDLVDEDIIDPDNIDPANFVEVITNQYFPLIPGTTFFYTGQNEEGLEVMVETEVTDQIEVILGVNCTVVKDSEYEDGELVEETYDWYAQDLEGNVWYFGEKSNEIEDGQVVSMEGSWRAGEDGATPGILMLGDPQPGQKYRQENLEGEAEDRAEVVSLDNTITVPFGTFNNCLKTLETNPLEPGFEEFKYYAPGIGFILAEEVGEDAFEELVDITQ